MTNVGVIGGGLIGASWAAIFSKSGFNVYVYDSHPTVFETYIKRVKLFLEELKINQMLPFYIRPMDPFVHRILAQQLVLIVLNIVYEISN